jgi:tRNA-binding protein
MFLLWIPHQVRNEKFRMSHDNNYLRRIRGCRHPLGDHCEGAKKPAFKIWVDFGPELGVKQSSAQITVNYSPESLVGRQVAGAVNLGTKNIAGFESQFLVLGFEDENGAICLVTPDPKVPNGRKLH